jgi:hypothetical protein
MLSCKVILKHKKVSYRTIFNEAQYGKRISNIPFTLDQITPNEEFMIKKQQLYERKQ